MKKIYICVTACELRLLDAKKIYNYFIKNGHKIVYTPEEAEVIIFVTCAFSEEQADNVLRKIKGFQKHNAELIVSGCLPDIEPERLAEIFNGRTVTTKELNKIDELFPDHKVKFRDIDDANVPLEFLYGPTLTQQIKRSNPVVIIKNSFRKIPGVERLYLRIKDHVYKHLFYVRSLLSRFLTNKPFYVIRISWGCPGNCSYCAAKRAVGQLKSKPIDQCIKELEKGLKKGFKLFVLNADDTGAYGLDIGSSFPKLMDEMTKISGDYEILVLNLNPRWIIRYIDQLEEILKRGKITSLEIPIQSSSSRILKLMHRYFDTGKMKEAFLRLKKACPDLSIIVHYILGFPTETNEDFKKSLNFIAEMNFNGGYFFIFSSRSGTVAATIEPKISRDEISKRIKYGERFLKRIGYNVMISKINSIVFTKK